MVNTTHTDQRLLQEAAALADPAGVLSVYVGVLPVEESGPTPRQVIELRHALDGAAARLAADRARAAALAQRIRELDADLDALVSPREAGRGRALFAGLSGGDPIRASFDVPFAIRVTAGERAHLRPLAAAHEVTRPAGVVVVSVDGIHLFEWSPHEAVELGDVELAGAEAGRELRGPAAPRPRSAPFAATGARSGSQRDLFEHRVLAHREQRAGEEAAQVVAVAHERGWDEIVLAGDERMLRPVEQAVAGQDAHVVVDHRLLGWLEPSDLAAAVAEPIADARAERRAALCARIRDEALAGGRGVLGVPGTLAALEAGRVERLVLGEEDPLEPAAGLQARDPGEPDLGDAMIARAFATGAAVTVVPSREREALGAEPAAALLRW